MALADAQSQAIRTLLSKAAYDSNVTPGPPLPRSHPAPALIAKLHLDCMSLYSSARSLVKATGSRKRPSSASEPAGDVSAELRRYLADECAFHGALSRKWLGVDAGEKGGTAKGGDAVGFLAWAKKDLDELKDSGRGITISRRGEREMRDRLKVRVTDELESVKVFFKYYKKANDTVSDFILHGGKLESILRIMDPTASLPTCPNTGRTSGQDTSRNDGGQGEASHPTSSCVRTWVCGASRWANRCARYI